MQRTDSGITAPREYQPIGRAHADQLVIDQIRRHANQSQVLDALADDLVAGGERNQVREALHGHVVAAMHVQRDGLL
jgi:hypothetical protein